MPRLYAAGVRYDRMVTVSAVGSSADGYIWGEPSEPFVNRQSAIGIATDGRRLVAVSDDGYISDSPDGINWLNGSIIDGDFGPRDVSYGTNISGSNGIFIIVGSQKYARDEPSHLVGDEVAQILTSVSGLDSTWLMVYSQDSNNSILHGIERIGDMWVACGIADDKPLLLYSLDDGFSWVRVDIPDLFDGRALFDVAYANNQYFVSAYGVILYTPSLETPVWNASDFIESSVSGPDFIKIASNPVGHIVAVSSGMLLYSLDGVEWKSYQQPGYQFTSVTWFNDHWIVGCQSLLTHYTYFTSTDTVNWTGANNGIHMYDFAVLP